MNMLHLFYKTNVVNTVVTTKWVCECIHEYDSLHSQIQ